MFSSLHPCLVAILLFILRLRKLRPGYLPHDCPPSPTVSSLGFQPGPPGHEDQALFVGGRRHSPNPGGVSHRATCTMRPPDPPVGPAPMLRSATPGSLMATVSALGSAGDFDRDPSHRQGKHAGLESLHTLLCCPCPLQFTGLRSGSAPGYPTPSPQVCSEPWNSDSWAPPDPSVPASAGARLSGGVHTRTPSRALSPARFLRSRAAPKLGLRQNARCWHQPT